MERRISGHRGAAYSSMGSDICFSSVSTSSNVSSATNVLDREIVELFYEHHVDRDLSPLRGYLPSPLHAHQCPGPGGARQRLCESQHYAGTLASRCAIYYVQMQTPLGNVLSSITTHLPQCMSHLGGTLDRQSPLWSEGETAGNCVKLWGM